MVRFLHAHANLMRLFSGMAAGYLISVTLVRILPEAMILGGESAAFWALGGFLLVHVIEHGISSHFHYGEETHTHVGDNLTGVMALVGLALHSCMDGMAITAAMRVQTNLGLLVFLGILLHRIPEGATISSIFLVRGFGSRGAIIAAGVLAAAAMAGSVGQDYLKLPVGPVLGVAGGLGLYVASADLLPQVQREKGWKSTLSLAAGILLFLFTAFLAPHHHGV